MAGSGCGSSVGLCGSGCGFKLLGAGVRARAQVWASVSVGACVGAGVGGLWSKLAKSCDYRVCVEMCKYVFDMYKRKTNFFG